MSLLRFQSHVNQLRSVSPVWVHKSLVQVFVVGPGVYRVPEEGGEVWKVRFPSPTTLNSVAPKGDGRREMTSS